MRATIADISEASSSLFSWCSSSCLSVGVVVVLVKKFRTRADTGQALSAPNTAEVTHWETYVRQPITCSHFEVSPVRPKKAGLFEQTPSTLARLNLSTSTLATILFRIYLPVLSNSVNSSFNPLNIDRALPRLSLILSGA